MRGLKVLVLPSVLLTAWLLVSQLEPVKKDSRWKVKPLEILPAVTPTPGPSPCAFYTDSDVEVSVDGVTFGQTIGEAESAFETFHAPATNSSTEGPEFGKLEFSADGLVSSYNNGCCLRIGRTGQVIPAQAKAEDVVRALGVPVRRWTGSRYCGWGPDETSCFLVKGGVLVVHSFRDDESAVREFQFPDSLRGSITGFELTPTLD